MSGRNCFENVGKSKVLRVTRKENLDDLQCG
jgi:hypothetical protein